jgi:hypothetical protein
MIKSGALSHKVNSYVRLWVRLLHGSDSCSLPVGLFGTSLACKLVGVRVGMVGSAIGNSKHQKETLTLRWCINRI